MQRHPTLDELQALALDRTQRRHGYVASALHLLEHARISVLNAAPFASPETAAAGSEYVLRRDEAHDLLASLLVSIEAEIKAERETRLMGHPSALLGTQPPPADVPESPRSAG